MASGARSHAWRLGGKEKVLCCSEESAVIDSVMASCIAAVGYYRKWPVI